MKSGKLLIGWASEDITPSGTVSLAGQFHLRITDKVKDPVTATALALSNADGSEQTVMVSIDAVWISDLVMARCREKLKQADIGFNPANLVINATHTHTAPAQPTAIFSDPPWLGKEVLSSAAYGEFLADKLVNAVVAAWNGRKPGAVSWGRGLAIIGFNRRVSYFNGSSVMYGKTDDPQFSHIEGYEDHGVDLLFTYDSEHELTGMVINVPCPSQCTEGEWFVSADYWHDTRCRIRERHGDKLFILPQCSAAGDQSPRTMVNRRADARMQELKGYGEEYNMARRQDIAQKLASVVDEVLPVVAGDIRDEVEFVHDVTCIDLPQRKATEDDLAEAIKEVAFWNDRLNQLEGKDRNSVEYSSAWRRRAFNQRVIDMVEEQQKGKITIPVELHALRIGDVAMCSNRFEYFVDFGLRIKARSKALQTFVVQLAGNGTYLPTTRAMQGGSYGAYIASTPIGAEGGQRIVEEELRMINNMFKDEDGE